MARIRMSEQERSARVIYRALTELSNFAEFQRPQVVARAAELLRERGWKSVADFVDPITHENTNPMFVRVMRQINEVATGSATQSEAICQIIVWSEKALRIAEGK